MVIAMLRDNKWYSAGNDWLSKHPRATVVEIRDHFNFEIETTLISNRVKHKI
jgi:hypothetical protein